MAKKQETKTEWISAKAYLKQNRNIRIENGLPKAFDNTPVVVSFTSDDLKKLKELLKWQ